MYIAKTVPKVSSVVSRCFKNLAKPGLKPPGKRKRKLKQSVAQKLRSRAKRRMARQNYDRLKYLKTKASTARKKEQVGGV